MQRDHYRLLDAAEVLRFWVWRRFDLEAWLGRKFGKQASSYDRSPLQLSDLTLAQVRQARRSLNAWAHSDRPITSRSRVVTGKSTSRIQLAGVK